MELSLYLKNKFVFFRLMLIIIKVNEGPIDFLNVTLNFLIN